MARIQVSSFQGIAPRLDPRLLDESQGQIAENLRLTSFALQSWRESIQVDLPNRVGTLKTIYRYEGTGSPIYLTWTTDVDVVKAPISNDTTERLYWTGEGAPKSGDNADNSITGINATGGTDIYPENSVTLGYPAPTAAPTVAIGGSGAGTSPVDKIYVYTFVSAWGEESAPSPASAIITVDHADGDVDLSAMETTVPAGYNTLDKTRIYRSLVGSSSATFQLVAEITPAATHTDGLVDTSLGEIIPSTDYDLPPSDMFGLLDFGNGILVGFTEYEVMFCEPYQPHAWPVKYRLAVVDKIVGGGVFGNTLVVCTDDRPVLVVGNHPSTMTQTLHPDRQACVSKQGIVSMKKGVLFPSPNGIYQIGYGGSGLITEGLYDRETWQLRNPQQLRATHWDTRYIGFTDEKGIVIETANNQILASDFNIDVDAIYNDAQNEDLYVAQSPGGTNTIFEFNVGGQRISYKWKSKKFSLGSQATITCGKILAQYGQLFTAPELAALQTLITDAEARNATKISSGRLTGELNGAALNVHEVNGGNLETVPSEPVIQNVVIRLYGDGVLIGEATAGSDKPFRFPSGSRHRQFEIEIEAFTDVNQITIASSISDLLTP
jgi:hypothetical protein